MAATIDIQVQDEGVRAVLAALQARGANMAPAMRLVGEIVVESIQRNFEQHRSPEGVPWKPLSDSYAAWKTRKKGRSADAILILNRHLMNVHPVVGPDSVAIGPGMETQAYAAIHQFGGLIPKPKGGRGRGLQKPARSGKDHLVRRSVSLPTQMPSRPYLGVRVDDWAEIESVLTLYLTSLD